MDNSGLCKSRNLSDSGKSDPCSEHSVRRQMKDICRKCYMKHIPRRLNRTRRGEEFHGEDAGLDFNMTLARNHRVLPLSNEFEGRQAITLFSPIVCTISHVSIEDILAVVGEYLLLIQ